MILARNINKKELFKELDCKFMTSNLNICLIFGV